MIGKKRRAKLKALREAKRFIEHGVRATPLYAKGSRGTGRGLQTGEEISAYWMGFEDGQRHALQYVEGLIADLEAEGQE